MTRTTQSLFRPMSPHILRAFPSSPPHLLPAGAATFAFNRSARACKRTLRVHYNNILCVFTRVKHTHTFDCISLCPREHACHRPQGNPHERESPTRTYRHIILHTARFIVFYFFLLFPRYVSGYITTGDVCMRVHERGTHTTLYRKRPVHKYIMFSNSL